MPINNVPTIAELTARREAQTAENLAAIKANREGRDELRKQSPDWWMRKDNYPTEQR
jgi:hypothetical protein